MCIGVLIGLVKVALKEAWLTVLDGYRPGRQLILAGANIILGRAEYATLPFMGRNDATEVELEHARLVRRRDGRFFLEDNHSRTGVLVNHRKVTNQVLLNDGDTIRIGSNTIQFREKHRREGAEETTIATRMTDSPPSSLTTAPIIQPEVAPPPPRPVAPAPPRPRPTIDAPPNPSGGAGGASTEARPSPRPRPLPLRWRPLRRLVRSWPLPRLVR